MKDDLYQQAIVELAKRARDLPRLEDPDLSITVDNPLCGDRVTLDLKLAGDVIEAVGHKTRGCLLCEATSGLIVEQTPGKAKAGLDVIAKAVIDGFADENQSLDELWAGLGVLAPARSYKSRHDCVRLPFQALVKMLERG